MQRGKQNPATAKSAEIALHMNTAKGDSGDKPQTTYETEKRMRNRTRSQQAREVHQNTLKTHKCNFSFQSGLK